MSMITTKDGSKTTHEESYEYPELHPAVTAKCVTYKTLRPDAYVLTCEDSEKLTNILYRVD